MKGTGFVVLAALVIAAGCAPDARDLHVVEQVKSPDRLLTAAYVQDTAGGAAVGTGQDVYVFKGGMPDSYSDRVFSDECVNDVHISWLGPTELRIAYGARAGHRISRDAGPWWTFGRKPHALTLRYAAHVTNSTYC